MEIRCTNKKHGELENGVFETTCNSRFCGAGAGIVVLHGFNVASGELVYTKKFKNPRKGKATWL